MTVRFAGGKDYEGVACFKITKGDRDPRQIPDSERGAFYFNSKWAADVRVISSEIMPTMSLGAFSTYFYPPGSGTSSYTWCADNYSNAGNSVQQLNYYRNSSFPDLVYDLPLHEVKPIRITNGRFVQNGMIISYRGYEDRGTRRSTPNAAYYGWCKNYRDGLRTVVGSVDGIPQLPAFPTTPSSGSERFRSALAVWNLPGDETPIRDGIPQAPIFGQRVIVINKDGIKVAKPGFDTRTATTTQLALDSSKRPAKIIAADDIALPAGVTEYNLGFAVPASTLVDVHYYIGNTIYYPASPSDLNFGGEHWISGGKLYFNNVAACRARFIVYAFDNTPQTVGNNDVWRRLMVDGQRVIQVLRPGASANPSFADIVLDSRWPCLQILKEGFIPVGSGLQEHNITFEGGAEVFPFVKYTTVHPGQATSGLGVAIDKSVRQPRVAIGRVTHGGSVHVPLYQCGDSTYCRLTDTQATFYTARGAPIWAFWATSQDYTNKNVTYEYDVAPLYGIRYYIFGLPKKD